MSISPQEWEALPYPFLTLEGFFSSAKMKDKYTCHTNRALHCYDLNSYLAKEVDWEKIYTKWIPGFSDHRQIRSHLDT